MKKILFLLLLIPAIGFGQEDKIKSAEDFVRAYLKLFEDKDWEAIPDMYAEGSQIVGFGDSIYSLPKSMESILESKKKDNPSTTIDIKWIKTEVTGPNTVLVTTKYFDTTNRSGGSFKTENINNFLLEEKENNWKIKMWMVHINTPIINNENLDKKYFVGNYPAFWKYTSLLNSSYDFQCCVADYFKKNGISPSELGNKLGKQYADRWDEKVDYKTLISSFIGFLTYNSPYLEIIEQTDNSLKVKVKHQRISESWDVTIDEMRIFSQNLWAQIANKVGANYSVTDDGQYWTIVLSKR